jgi:hypothetical protein
MEDPVTGKALLSNSRFLTKVHGFYTKDPLICSTYGLQMVTI